MHCIVFYFLPVGCISVEADQGVYHKQRADPQRQLAEGETLYKVRDQLAGCLLMSRAWPRASW